MAAVVTTNIPLMTHLPCFGKGFADFAVASTVACGDEIGHATALQESGGGDWPRGAEDLRKGDHLHQAQPDHGGFGVVSVAQAVTETSSNSHYVLQGNAEGETT